MYLDIVKPFYESEEENLDEAKDDIAALLDAFLELSPTKQQIFLSALFYRYRSEEVMDTMLFAYPDLKVKGYFIYFIVLYLGEYMPECREITQDTLLAVEYYLNKDKYDNALENFFEKMEAIKAAYNEAFTDSDYGLIVRS